MTPGTTDPRVDAAPGGAAEPGTLAQLCLTPHTRVQISADRPGWRCRLEVVTGDDPAIVRQAEAGDGAAEALVARLRAMVTDDQPAEGFRLVRLATPPEALGERAILVDQTNTSVVVGERVIVKWLHRLRDGEHPAPVTLAHLAAVGYAGVPATYGVLLWRTPGGVEVPCAMVSGYLPGARDGYTWCVDVVEQVLARRLDPDTTAPRGDQDADRVVDLVADLPERLAHLLAGLHLCLATPSDVVPEPVRLADTEVLRRWHAEARQRLDQACTAAADVEGSPEAASTLLAHRPRLEAAIDTLADLADTGATVLVQRVHGDLHAGQILRWSGGLAVVDFDGNPVVGPVTGTAEDPAVQPAARDLAHLLCSLDQIGRIVDRRSGFTRTAEVDAWSADARARLLTAYRTRLAAAGQARLLDERVLPAFEADQVCREVLYAAHFLPVWLYATLGRVRGLYAAGD